MVDTMIIAIVLLALLFPSTAAATVFWTEDFEGHLSTGPGTYSPWLTDACLGYGGFLNPNGTNPAPDGCKPELVGGSEGSGPKISSDTAHTGSKSLKSHFGTANQCNQAVQSDCGRFLDRPHTASDHVWMRWYSKWTNCNSADTCLNPYGGQKQMYSQAFDGFEIAWFIKQGWNGALSLQNSHGNVAVDCNAQGSSGGPQAGCEWLAANNVSVFDGNWHCYETHAYAGTLNNLDGIVETWVDGVQGLSHNHVAFKVSGAFTGATFNNVRTFAQWGGGDRYQDDLVVADSRIGCNGAPPTPPPPPTNLVVIAIMMLLAIALFAWKALARVL